MYYLFIFGYKADRSGALLNEICKLRVELNHKKSMTYKNVFIESYFISICSFFIFHFSFLIRMKWLLVGFAQRNPP